MCEQRLPLGRALQALTSRPSSSVRSLLRSGAVSVNGVVEHSYSRKVTADFVIRVEGEPLPSVRGAASGERDALLLLAHYKPCGVVTSLCDERGRQDVSSAIPPRWRRAGLHPVGRLDRHSHGLLLWTTDGRLTRALLDPAFALPREYEAVVCGRVEEELLRAQLAAGVHSHFEAASYVASLKSVRPFLRGVETYLHAACDPSTHDRRNDGPQRRTVGVGEACEEEEAERRRSPDSEVLSVVRLVLYEGKKREVRRMLAHCGHPVVDLKRLAYGCMRLGELKPGDVREASVGEKEWAVALLETVSTKKQSAVLRIQGSNRLEFTIAIDCSLQRDLFVVCQIRVLQ